jgi:hypothetical protein
MGNAPPAARFGSEKVVIIHQIARRHIPEDSTHYSYNREKLKPRKMEASGI